jgi:hypothetical protein
MATKLAHLEFPVPTPNVKIYIFNCFNFWRQVEKNIQFLYKIIAGPRKLAASAKN